jgi:hypothetical protein
MIRRGRIRGGGDRASGLRLRPRGVDDDRLFLVLDSAQPGVDQKIAHAVTIGWTDVAVEIADRGPRRQA